MTRKNPLDVKHKYYHRKIFLSLENIFAGFWPRVVCFYVPDDLQIIEARGLAAEIYFETLRLLSKYFVLLKYILPGLLVR